MCEGVSADTRQAGSKPRLSPNSRLGPAGSPGAPGLPALGQSCHGLPASAGRVVAGSPQSPSAATPSQGASGPPGVRRDPGPGSRSPRPAPPPPLTCSALCGSSGVRQPGKRRTGCRRQRCPRPAGSRWWSPHGSAVPAAAAAAAAAAARGGSSRRRRRRGGDQNPAGRIVRRLAARERAEDPAGRPRPGRRCCLRSGEAGRYPRLRPPPPPPNPPLTLLPSWCAPLFSAAAFSRPGSSRAASPSPGTPREVAAKGAARGRRAARRLSRAPGREGMGAPGFAFSPGAQVLSGRAAQLCWCRLSLSPARSESCRLCLTE